MPLPTARPDYDRYIKQVCRVGQGAACCRYLTMGVGGWSCVKHDGVLRSDLDARVALRQMNARGDNCAGYVPPDAEDQRRRDVLAACLGVSNYGLAPTVPDRACWGSGLDYLAVLVAGGMAEEAGGAEAACLEARGFRGMLGRMTMDEIRAQYASRPWAAEILAP